MNERCEERVEHAQKIPVASNVRCRMNVDYNELWFDQHEYSTLTMANCDNSCKIYRFQLFQWKCQ